MTQMSWHQTNGERSPESEGPPERFEPRPVPPRPSNPWRLPGSGPDRAPSSGTRPRETRSDGPSGAKGSGSSKGQRKFSGDRERSWPSWLPWVAVILLLSVAVVPLLLQRNDGKPGDYTTFIADARAGRIAQADISNASGHITAIYKDSGQKVSISGPLRVPDEDIRVGFR